MRYLTALSFSAFILCFSSGVKSENCALTVTGASTWKPFSFINEKGEPDGIMVDYWRLYAKENKVTICFDLKPWSESLDYVIKTPNVIHGGLGYTTSRASYLFFSSELPLKRYDVYLFAQKDLPFDDLYSIKSTRIGTVERSTKHAFLTAQIPEKNTRIYPDFGALNNAAYEGEIDFFIDDLSSALYDMRVTNNQGLFTPRRKLYSFPLHFAINKKSKARLAELEEGISRINEKDIEAIYNKWLTHSDLQKDTSYLNKNTKNALISFFLIITGLGLLAYRKRFKHSLAELKTTITALNDSNERLQYIVQNDPITGAKTRHQFFSKLNELRFTPSPYVIAVVGIEHLKLINQTYGQDIGDMALKHLATQMRLLLSNQTTIARLGGGKFAILFELSDQSQATKGLQKLKIARQIKSFYIDQQLIPIEFCYGMASYPHDGLNNEELVRIAKEKMRSNRKKMPTKKLTGQNASRSNKAYL